MKAVLQRVINASVTVDGKIISSIGKGLLVLVGIDRYDEPQDATQIIKKILTARLWEDENGVAWKKNVKDIDGEVLCVSQFTLLAGFKGSKPDFHESMSTIPGNAFYSSFLKEIKTAYDPSKIQDGQFGAMMQVSLTNDGPVTILLSSKDKPGKSGTTTSTPSATASGISTPLEGKKKNKGKGKFMTENKVDQQLGGTKNADLLGTSISTQQDNSAAEDKIDKLSVNENTSSR
ncbi:D-tyrosyl-tRNA(Tyr) deacylase [Cryptococcus bacillisporus CA1280]|uniref:D-aminoacyl-tRNA deacylase n=2 Tax=Cryptococcus gattii TaxID=552467 RepID=A0A0D0UQU5_CRYGA|nr:D-tyrosyl-tRNA(Tyr) deacylase [Cryptococcus bacillisporus CA1280]KIR58686.1 D-tyrosyl-tRNA(Tyr) deacylase [Cryptococcus bacillisporus CA1873]|eukprot:KIR58686.1 D-tyrosyl-tRNA(Tyr) deacylase [Cryptococcus gattii CA1873]